MCIVLFVSVVDSQHIFNADVYSDVHYCQYHTDVSTAEFILLDAIDIGLLLICYVILETELVTVP